MDEYTETTAAEELETPEIEPDEQFFHKHYVRFDTNDILIRGFSDAFEQPQPGDICINEQGGRHFELGGIINPPLRNEQGIPLYKWDVTEVKRRTEEELEAHRQALEESPAAQIIRLDREIHRPRNMAKVLAHLYDIAAAQVQSLPAAQYGRFTEALEARMPALSPEEFEYVQVEGEPNATGASDWREMKRKRDELVAEIAEGR